MPLPKSLPRRPPGSGNRHRRNLGTRHRRIGGGDPYARAVTEETPTPTTPAVSTRNDLATISILTGVVGIIGCFPLVFSAVSILYGSRGLKAAKIGLATNPGEARAGLILGWIGLVLWGAILGVLMLFVLTHNDAV